MDEKKAIEFFNRIYEMLNEEQKAKAQKCETAEEFLGIAGDAGVSLPDGLLDGISGGIFMNQDSNAPNLTTGMSIIGADVRRPRYPMANNPGQSAEAVRYADVSIPVTGTAVKSGFTAAKTLWGQTTLKKL